MKEFQKVCDSTVGESYFYRIHESGLPLYVIPKKHSATFAMFGTQYGSIDCKFKTDKDTDYLELPDGVAHFLEHKMFEDENGVDAFTRYAETGASANAFTSFDRTCYLFSCTEGFDQNLEILLDFVSHPYFTADTVKKEQGIIGEEIAMYDDNPGWCVFFNLLKCLYKNHPIRQSIVGTRESIAQITPEMLYRCTDTFYNLRNMVLIVCGDVTPQQVNAVCDKMLTKEAPVVNVERVFPEEPEEINMPYAEDFFEISQPMVEIGFKDIPSEDPEERIRISAANAINMQLLFGKSGEFYNRLYESGLISDKFGGAYAQERTAAFTEVSALCNDPHALKDAVCAEIEKRRESYFTPEEFEIAKRVVYANNLFNFDSTDDIANTFMTFWQNGGDYLSYSSCLSKIGYEEAWKVLKDTIRTDRCAMSVVYPKEGKDE
ncbi:MAG: insulinase family protein [Clostridia bacterium]|nr:insulinase family protein [Clostridia bacterium]